MMHEVIT